MSTGLSRGIAFVRFGDVIQARNAISELNNSVVTGGDKPILVKFADTDDERVQRKQRQVSRSRIMMRTTENTNVFSCVWNFSFEFKSKKKNSIAFLFCIQARRRKMQQMYSQQQQMPSPVPMGMGMMFNHPMMWDDAQFHFPQCVFLSPSTHYLFFKKFYIKLIIFYVYIYQNGDALTCAQRLLSPLQFPFALGITASNHANPS
jgi:hypothetical protein